MEQAIAQKRLLAGYVSRELAREIVDSLTRGAQGTFLWPGKSGHLREVVKVAVVHAEKAIDCGIRAAVSINLDGTVGKVSKELILHICSNFVVLDTELDTFRFAHLSVVEFLGGQTLPPQKHAWSSVSEVA
ncbi:hypothetical protein OEA41_001422 [Lepraria neglecta]|uniref:Uncharacterized protein n=1 Tax=Lepraria neglecta TaxID=209136 RepID=A0AAD9ZD76_9LECA|nr:hypothetical protein OEA41_001422 [Lepraria neglecta]